MLYYILLFSFTTGAALACALYLIFTSDKRSIENRINKYVKEEVSAEELQENDNKEKSQISSPRKLLARISRVFASQKISTDLQKELIKADVPLRGEEFITLILLFSAGIFFSALILLQNVALASVFMLIGLVMPKIYINAAKSKKVTKFNNQISDTLVMMANSLRAGFSFLQVMDLISKEMAPPISQEFGRTFREINLGISTEEALDNLSGRVESPDLEMTVTAVLIQRQIGGNLAEVLENISETIRERVRIKGEIKTLTAQGRISGLVVGLLPLALLGILMIINPSYISLLFVHPVGLMLLGGAVFAEILGIMLIRKIVNIKI
ncbi:MAG: secretion system protein [Firmicutes bacterium HGW-Firmicutes-13]|nr:MAG: secretion system protein [Firmicutes bacterium HGW-Firmicutes-13]